MGLRVPVTGQGTGTETDTDMGPGTSMDWDIGTATGTNTEIGKNRDTARAWYGHGPSAEVETKQISSRTLALSQL